MDPKVSVIIVAHNRRNFLPNAIQSVLNQSISKNLFEVLIVKNFIDEEFDNHFLSKGLQIITTKEQSLGSKIIAGVKNCNGGIISFLEDDDIFLENKLETVIKAFSDNRLIYYHNNYSTINEKGNSINFKPLYIARVKKSLRVDTNDLSLRKLSIMGNSNGFFNLSCISIRKSLILGYLGSLQGLDVAVDNFFFYLAIDSGYCIFIDKKVLTEYRVHNSNSSLVVTSNKSLFCNKKVTFFKKDFAGFHAIQEVIQNELLREYLLSRSLVPELALSIYSQEKGHLLTGWVSLISSVKIRSIPLFILSVIYIIYLFFPATTIRALYNYENRKMLKISVY